MTSIRSVFLLLFGICAGGMIAAGIYAFLAIIGVFARLIGKTGTGKHILLYETVIIMGGILGNILDTFEVPIVMRPWAGILFNGLFGLSVGIFVGCLAMSLAETLKALPTISRRLRLAVGLPWIIVSLAAGKALGSFLYFWKGMGA